MAINFKRFSWSILKNNVYQMISFLNDALFKLKIDALHCPLNRINRNSYNFVLN